MAEYHTMIIDNLCEHLQEQGCITRKEHHLWFMDKRKRVDCVGYKDKVIWCFEVKTYREDIYSGNGRNYVGNFNYIVVPDYLRYDAERYVKDKCPYIGIVEYEEEEFKERKSPVFMPINDTLWKNIYRGLIMKNTTKTEIAKVLQINKITLDKYLSDYKDYIAS